MTWVSVTSVVYLAGESKTTAQRFQFHTYTLVYRIDVQYGINVQVGKFLKNIKRAGQNRRTGGKLSGKSINVQGENFLENRVKLKLLFYHYSYHFFFFNNFFIF